MSYQESIFDRVVGVAWRNVWKTPGHVQSRRVDLYNGQYGDERIFLDFIFDTPPETTQIATLERLSDGYRVSFYVSGAQSTHAFGFGLHDTGTPLSSVTDWIEGEAFQATGTKK